MKYRIAQFTTHFSQYCLEFLQQVQLFISKYAPKMINHTKPLRNKLTKLVTQRITKLLKIISSRLWSLIPARQRAHWRTHRRKLAILAGALILLVGPTVYLTLIRPNQTKAAPWATTATDWQKRKRLSLINNSGQTLIATTTYSITLNTKELVDAGDLNSDCSDLRIYYQPDENTNTKLAYYFDPASGTTNCADSTATKVYFPLQTNLSNNVPNFEYYLYYDNDSAVSEASVSAFDVGGKQATLVCPFNGDTTCVNSAGAETPTTETGAIRYSGSKSAMSFDGSDNINVGNNQSINNLPNGNFTIETWIYPNAIYPDAGYFNSLFAAHTSSDSNYYDAFIGNDTKSIRVNVKCSDTTAVAISTANSINFNQWSHIAITYDQITKIPRIFVNGQEVSYSTQTACSGTYSDDSSYNKKIGVNHWGANYHRGFLDEFRISNTVRYTSNFTPQTTPFVRDEYTKLLLHFDENGDDPRNTGKAIDDSGNANHGTITGAKYVSGLVGVDASATDTGNNPSQSYASHEGVFIEEGTTNKVTNPSFEHSTYSTNWANGGNDFTTFTPSMAKRNSAGPFAAGPLIQGKLDGTSTSDLLYFSPGTNLYGQQFHTNLDQYQGSVVFWITPEWNGNDGINHQILWGYSDGWWNLNLVKNSSNNLVFTMNSTLVTVSASSWVAGSTYQIVLRWDRDNPLDGTNYASISVNDSHTFGRNSAFGTNSVAGNQYIGSKNDGSFATNAIIEGMTIYRRPLFDGTYGIDVGNGDEINLMYNSGTGQDPTLVTGSWDVVFALPTNSSTGTLGTTGEAWTHPHSSNLLYTSTTNTGGFMMNGTYTSDGWANEGTPTTVAALATSEKIFAGGYKTTSDAANEGIYRDITTTAGSDFVIRAMAHSNGTSIPKIIFYDQSNGAEIGSMTGTTASTRTAPNVFLFTGEAPTGCTTIRVKLVNTQTSGIAYWHQVEVLSNSIDEPSLEAGAGAPWIVDGWTNSNLVSGDSLRSSSPVYSGIYSLSYVWGGSPLYKNVYQYKTQSLTSGGYYSAGGQFRSTISTVSSGDRQAALTFTNMVFQNGLTLGYPYYTQFTVRPSGASGSWWRGIGVGRANSTSGQARIHGVFYGADTYYYDDLFLIQTTGVSLTVAPASSANSIESNKIRVDGRDTYTHTYPGTTTTAGTYTFDYTPRHSAADVAKFGEATPFIAQFYGDADDYIKLSWSAANTVKLEYQMNGGTVTSGTWDATSAIAAGTNYRMIVNYTGSGSMTLSVDGVTKITLSSIPTAFGTAPATAYWGSDQAGIQQGDATFLPQFTTYSANTTAPFYKFSTKSAKIDNSIAPEPRGYVTSINPGNTNVHTLSAYVYDGTTGNIGGTVSATVAKLVFNGAVVTPAAYTDMGGGWWRLSYSAATVNAAGDYGVQALAGKTIYVDGVQLEELPYSTSYVDGSLGTGYTWSGSANASSSNRTTNTLNYSAGIPTNDASGAVSFWLKPNWNAALAPGARNITGSYLKVGSGGWGWGNGFIIGSYITTGGTTSGFRIAAMGSGSTGCDVNTTITQNKWYHVLYSWNGASSKLYINYSLTCTHLLNTTTDTGNLMFGAGYTSVLNSQISDTTFYSDPLTDSEVASIYYSGLGSHELQTDSTEQFAGQEEPVAFWRFDEGYGEIAYDSSNQGNNASIIGATWSDDEFGSAPDGKSLQFDGTNDYVAKTYNNDIELDPGTKPFSVSAWFKSPSTPPATQMNLISRYAGAGYKIYMTSNGRICFAVDDDSTWDQENVTCSTSVINYASFSDSSWHYVTAVKDESSISVYIDGIRAGTASLSATGSLSGSQPTFYTGIESDGSSYPWKGFIDEVRVYTYALNTAQIMTEYAARGSVKGISAGFIGEGAEGALGQGLVGYWKMDEASWNGTSGEVIDSSGNSNNGTAVGASGIPTTGAGKFSNGGIFDGSDDSVDYTTTYSFSNEVTISAWFNTSTLTLPNSHKMIFTTATDSSYLSLIESGDAYPFMSLNIGGIQKTLNSLFTPSVGQWYLVTGTYDGNYMRIFINGELKNTLAVTGSLAGFNSGTTTHIAKYNYDGYNFDGKIDEVRVYNRALSPAEIQSLYNWAPGPVVHWKMDEGSGQSTQDSSGKSNTGTLGASSATGADDPTWTTGKYGQALSFDGTDDYTHISNPAFDDFGTGDMSVGAWVKTTQQAYALIVDNKTAGTNNSGFNLQYAADGTPYFRIANGSAQAIIQATTTPIDDGLWHHVEGVLSRSSSAGHLKIYVDGVLKNSLTLTTELSWNISSSQTLYLATYGSTSFLQGSLDEVKIYNYARTPEQIVEDMNAGQPTVGSPIGNSQLYWKFDEGYGTTVNDSSGHNMTGTLGQLNSGSMPQWKNDGKHGKALYLNTALDTNTFSCTSNGNVVNLPSTAGSKITVSGWIRPDATQPWRNGYIVRNGNAMDENYSFYLSATPSNNLYKVGFQGYDGSFRDIVTSGYYVPAEEWSYITLIFSQDEWLKVYVNGVFKEQVTWTYNPTVQATTVFCAGGNNGSYNQWLKGYIDELKIFNYELSTDEIMMEYNHGAAIVLGSLSDTSQITGTPIPQNSAAAAYCVPGSSGACSAPVAEWKLDENTGVTAYDTSSNGNHGTLTSAMTESDWVPGKIGSALEFDNILGSVQVGDPASGLLDFGTGDFSLATWIKYKGGPLPSDKYAIITKGGDGSVGYGLSLFGTTLCSSSKPAVSALIQAAGGSNQFVCSAATELDPDTWYYVEAVFDRDSNVTIYINGKQAISTSISGNTGSVDSSTQLYIGSVADVLWHFNGLIDHTQIFNYARTPAQIAWDYNRGAPVAHYKMDECSGTTLHSSNETYNAALNGTWSGTGGGAQTAAGDCSTSGTAWGNGATGQFNASLNFDGTDDYVSVPSNSNFNITGDITIAVWFKRTGEFDRSHALVAKTNGSTWDYDLYFESGTGMPYFYAGSPSRWAAAQTPILDSNWHHLVVVRSGSTASFYLDGKFDVSRTFSGSLASNSLPLYIGTDLGGNSYFMGSIDDVQIFNYALTQDQIQTVYNNGAVLFTE